jgi:hypothetical protein
MQNHQLSPYLYLSISIFIPATLSTFLLSLQEPEVDTPVNSDDIESTEEADYVEEGEQLKPRQRSLPSYIKKEKPIISSESSEDDDDDDDDKDKKSQLGKDDDDSFPDIPDEEDDDIPVLEALFDEDDEVIRPSLKRTHPRIRKAAESDGSDSETSTGKFFFQTRRFRFFGLSNPDSVIIPVLRIRIFSIPDPGSKRFSDPRSGSASKNLSILAQKIVSKLSEI